MAIKVSGSTVVDDNKIFLPNNTASAETNVSISANTLTIDLNTAQVFEVTLNANITTLNVTNVQTNGRTSSFILVLIGDGTARAVSWPATFKWPGATAPTITSNTGKKDVYVFFTNDGGTTWQAFVSGQGL